MTALGPSSLESERRGRRRVRLAALSNAHLAVAVYRALVLDAQEVLTSTT